MIACYVSGAGMFAGTTTHEFKTAVIEWLESSGTGFDTRYRYYRQQFPELEPARLARLICDPIEHYDKEWLDRAGGAREQEGAPLARFVHERDARFRAAAQVAIYCFDEAGIGSGVNVMRFVHARKPVLGFYSADPARRRVNLTNVLQLELEFPDWVKLADYRTPADVTGRLEKWLPGRVKR